MLKHRLIALSILVLGGLLGYFVSITEPRIREMTYFPKASFISDEFIQKHFNGKGFKLGLDLAGGTQLTYKADVSSVKQADIQESMEALRDVIERRVNLFGVGEPVVQTEHSELVNEDRLVVDLPGITDVNSAIQMIGQTPTLEFKTERDADSKAAIKKAYEEYLASQNSKDKTAVISPLLKEDPNYVSTELTGRYLKRSSVTFNEQQQPEVSLEFDDQGAKLFAAITKANTGKTVAIYLDGAPISTPRVNGEISGGRAVIQGNFTIQEAKLLVGRLNSGALPVPITLIGTQSVGSTLGAQAVSAGVHAALLGFALVALFLVFWYRLPGLLAVLALTMYVSIILTLFKLIPVTITAAGIAGFIISIGLAVDANVLIFERMKEELRKNISLQEVIENGFARAWTSIRDSNISSLITAIILFWFGSSVVKGFALTFGLGVITSMISAIVISRVFLIAVAGDKKRGKFKSFLFGNGFTK